MIAIRCSISFHLSHTNGTFVPCISYSSNQLKREFNTNQRIHVILMKMNEIERVLHSTEWLGMNVNGDIRFYSVNDYSLLCAGQSLTEFYFT